MPTWVPARSSPQNAAFKRHPHLFPPRETRSSDPAFSAECCSHCTNGHQISAACRLGRARAVPLCTFEHLVQHQLNAVAGERACYPPACRRTKITCSRSNPSGLGPRLKVEILHFYRIAGLRPLNPGLPMNISEYALLGFIAVSGRIKPVNGIKALTFWYIPGILETASALAANAYPSHLLE